jgi:predicted enzyme related to lactoylglutathione lyase
MTEHPDFPIGSPCWADLMSSDIERAKEFYGALFGWSWETAGEEYGGYSNFSKDGEMVAGAMTAMPDGASDVWSVYLRTDDAEATAAAAKAHGGSVMVEPMAVGPLGTMAVLFDAGQAVIGMWQPGEHTGFGRLAEPGAPGWFELSTREYQKSLDFYRDVFSWDLHTVEDTEQMRYTTHGKDDQARAGIMDASGFLPEGVPSHWAVYWAVDDTDATLKEIGELGGSTLMPAEDTPYGRLAMAADPMGAVFKLVG